MKRSLILLLLLSAGCHESRTVSGPVYRTQGEKEAIGTQGMVVCAHPLAAQAGMQILKAGGNAVDAAIATQLALAVVYPQAGNLGGGGFMVAHLKGQDTALDYREKAPAAASRDMYLDAQGNVIPGKSVNGHLAAGVPGTVAGLAEAFKFARLPWKQLVAPAIALARQGFVLSAREAAGLNSIQKDLQLYNTVSSAFERGKPWKAGDTLLQPELAATLERIRDQGRDGFYIGRTARLLTDEMQRGKGIISLDDLKNYQAKWRSPHRFSYEGHEVIGMPMPSSGGVLLNQMMGMVEGRPLAGYGYGSADAIQLMTEVERRAYADRAEFMGDEDFVKVPAGLVSKSYLTSRMRDYQPYVAGRSKDVGPGLPPEHLETTHLSVMDAEGNAVSVTTTLNNSYGSKTVVGGAGFFLNDEMDDFSAKPGAPNIYGAVGGAANAIQPGKRMLSSMTPTIVLLNGQVKYVVGTPGGTTIPTSVFQTLVDLIDFHMSPADAVNKPKFHHQWLPDEIVMEPGFADTERQLLVRMGYHLRDVGGIGRVELIVTESNGSLHGVADRRGEDAAAGY